MMRAKFKLRRERIGVEITPFTTQIPHDAWCTDWRDSSLSFHMRFFE